jgi:hypothetical protein
MADKIETDFLKQVKAKSREAVKWFKDLVKQTTKAAFPAMTGRKDIRSQSVDIKGNLGAVDIGTMFFFQYNAKWDEILPYWDKFPLIFPFAPAKGGFYGINLHYLNPERRSKLMQALIKSQGSGGKMNENFQLKLNYNIISKFKPAKRCVKRYLTSHAKGGFYKISGEDWPYAVGLPLQNWKVNNRDIFGNFMKDWKE